MRGRSITRRARPAGGTAAAWRLLLLALAIALPAAVRGQGQAVDTTALLTIARSALAAQSQVQLDGNVDAALTRSGGIAERHRRGARPGLDRAAAIHRALAAKGHEYTGFRDTVEVLRLETAGDTARLTVAYHVRFQHRTKDAKSPAVVGEGYNHDLTFLRGADGWTLLAEREWSFADFQHKGDSPGALPAATAPKASPDAPSRGPVNRTKPSGSGGPSGPSGHGPWSADVTLTGSYNPDLAISYARRWSNASGGGYNPAYPNFAPWYKTLFGAGNDCTNFASQIVAAGGWMQVRHPSGVVDDDHYWWLADESDYSHSWSVSHDFHWWMYYSGRGYFGQSFADAIPGDVVQFDWSPNDGHIDHTMVMTSVDTYDWYLTGHSNDLQDEPLASISARNPGAAFYLFLMYSSY